jgi:hypothetical protein
MAALQKVESASAFSMNSSHVDTKSSAWELGQAVPTAA